MTYSIFKAKLKMLGFYETDQEYKQNLNSFRNELLHIYVYSASNIRILKMTIKGDIQKFTSYIKALNFIINIDK